MKVAAGVLLLALAAASPEIRYFRYERPIVNTPPQGGQTCLVVDAETFTHASAQLADLRLYGNGIETPYVIHLAASVTAVMKPIVLLNLGRQGGQTVFDAAMPDTPYSDIQLAVTGQNFIATVTVSGSQTQSGGATKIGAYTIFDLSRQRLGRSTVLHLPESDFRYLHFRIAGPLDPGDITGLSVLRLPTSKPRYETVAESSAVKQKGHSTVLELTVPAHVPVDRVLFTIGTAPAQFSRDVTVSVAPVSQLPATDESELPQSVTSSGNLLRVHSAENGHRIDEERLAIDAPTEDFISPAKWTITIDNGDDTPLTVGSAQLQMLQRDLCFEAAGNARYTLFYGDGALSAPQYDYATLFRPQANTALAKEGPEQANPAYQPRPDDRPFTEKHPALLWVVLIAVIALLGAIALRSARRTV
jgi:Protein of unknown function (DUF3999)